MNIENYIEAQYRELKDRGLNNEFEDLYIGIENVKFREILSTLHYEFTTLYRTMNERLPTGNLEAHFWAEPSRALIYIIEMTIGLYNAVKGSKYAFEIDEYYNVLIRKCRDFLCSSGGSALPPHMPKVELYYVQPIFKPSASVTISNINTGITYGSYIGFIYY